MAQKMMSKREKRARERYLRLVYINETETVVQKRISPGEWGDAHKLETDGSDAVDCSCPDSQIRGSKCYHQIAWEDWTFDKIVFHDGLEVEL